MNDGRAGHRDLEEVPTSFFGALLDRQRHFLGLAVPEADLAIAVSDHHECGEGEATAALDDLGDAVDGDDARLAQTIGILAAVIATTITVVVSKSHQNSSPASRAADATAAIRPW